MSSASASRRRLWLRWRQVEGGIPPFIDPYLGDDFSSRARRFVAYSLTYGDLFVQTSYHKAVESIPPLAWLRRQPVNRLQLWTVHPVAREFEVIPAHLDYLFLSYCVIAWVLVNWVFRLEFLGVVTHRKVLNKLRELNDVLEAQVTREQGAGIGSSHRPGMPNLLRRSQGFTRWPGCAR